MIRQLKEKQQWNFNEDQPRFERIGDLKEKQQELNEILKVKNGQLLKMKGRLLALQT